MKHLLMTAMLAGALSAEARTNALVTTIAFGSCANQGRAQDFWAPILAHPLDLFIFMGDNIYGDTANMKMLAQEYEFLGRQPGFQQLCKTARVLATWDDHDYGENDAGAEFEERSASREIFLDFWQVPADAPRRLHSGVYDAQVFGPPASPEQGRRGRRLQVILLDTRYFRDALVKLPERPEDDGPYDVNEDPEATMLGDKQWAWLEEQLREPAELRLLVSSIQVLSNEHHWEKWGTLPRERQRLLDLLRDTKATGVIILSGDRHRGEISCLAEGMPYPLYDVTGSALNMSHPIDVPEPNALRVGDLVMENNFGLMTIDWDQPDPLIRIELRDLEDKVRVEINTSLKDLR